MAETIPEGYKELFDVIADVLHRYKFDQTDFKCSGLVSRVKQSREKGEIDFTVLNKGVRYYQVDKFEQWAKSHIEDMKIFEYKEIQKFKNQKEMNENTLDMKDMEDEIEVLNGKVKKNHSSSTGVGSSGAGDKVKRRGRRTRIRIAVEEAYSALIIRLGMKPSADEVFSYLKNEDATGYIVDSTDDKVTWQDTRGKFHDSEYKTIANILSKVHRDKS